ncbi:type II toxin-antitoxin system Phd/YefM family antitoxin [Holdemania massiliensis]|uniref:type II toxin-antitoxin system Phd/YefM family antitoxin n=1 Tax=Holdemania massiliensis TaxID=1468449 RepID=UPI001F068C67|nr:type II toxin-antitoxin system Phd/YefM family antitoxin [Holdemania massiliensis]MCH1939892.1 type II toxin-antitoxin system Phd/YefM family antitoxin [Holdemania massiliensis]
MPHIIPIRDLKDTAAIAQLCNSSKEPIFITKNGYGEMVIMSMKFYEERILMQDVYEKLTEAEDDIHAKKTTDAHSALHELRARHGL